MREWFLENFDASMAAYLATLIGSIATAVASLANSINARRSCKKLLQVARSRSYWTTCPHCKKTIYLNEIAFHMPDGAIDDDLNGVADSDEVAK